LESINITSFMEYHPLLQHRQADIICIQEHLVTRDRLKVVKKVCAGQGFSVLLTPAVVTGGRPSAGVGILARKGVETIRVAAHDDVFVRMESLGRVGHFKGQVGSGEAISIFVIYGWANSATDIDAMADTDDLMRAVVREWRADRTDEVIIAGDLNAEPADVPCIRPLLGLGILHDVASSAHLAGEHADAPTCWATQSAPGNRRDCFLVAARTLARLTGYRRDLDADFPVHCPIDLDLVSHRPGAKAARCVKPKTIPLTGTSIEQIRVATDRAFGDHHDEMQELLSKQDLTSFWHRWSELAEGAAITASARAHLEDDRTCRGRGRVRIVQEPTEKRKVQAMAVDGNEATEASLAVAAALRAWRQVQQLIAEMHRARHQHGMWLWTVKALKAWAQIAATAELHCLDAELVDTTGRGRLGPEAFLARLREAAARAKARHAEVRKEEIAAKRKRLANALAADRAGKRHYQLLTAERPASLSFLEVRGAITSDPCELDKRARDQWGEIFNDNAVDHSTLTGRFFAKFGHLVPQHSEFPLRPLTGEQLQAVAYRAATTAAGLDE